MSELKVNKISPATGTAFTLGDSGDTFTVPSGATITNSGTANGFGTAGADTSLSNLSAAGEELACQAWINIAGTGTISIRDTGGINGFSSITDIATGMYGATFNSAMASADYVCGGSVIGTISGNFSCQLAGKNVASTTTIVNFAVENAGGTATEVTHVNLLVFGA